MDHFLSGYPAVRAVQARVYLASSTSR